MKYSTILFAALPILIFLPAVSSAEKINGFDVEWNDASTYTLSWTSPSVSIEDYSIKVVDFDWEGGVAVSVTHRGEIQNGIISQGEYRVFDFTHNSSTFQGIKIDPDEISGYDWLENPPVNIGTYPCCPQAEISVSVAKEASPALDMVTSLNWDGRLGYESTMDIQIENTGDAAFSGGNLTIDTGGLIPDEKKLSDYGFIYNPSKHIISRVWYTPLLANNSYNTSVSLKPIQMNPNTSSFIIEVDSNFWDSSGKTYTSTATSTVSLNNTINLEKTITDATAIGDQYTDEEDRGIVGLGKITVVNLYVTNMQSYSVRALNLIDSIIDGFDLVDNNTKLQWTFDINGSERKEFRYEMRARRTGSFEAPAATAKWTEWGATKLVSSNMPSTKVYGAYVLITKSTRKTTFDLNESINVSVRLENTGDLPAGINITDVIPNNTKLISGSTAFRGYIHPGEAVYITYELSTDQTGGLEFPSPQISFWQKDYQFSYKFKPAPNITIINSPNDLQGNTANPSANLEPISPVPTETPATTETPVLAETPIPKGLIDIINEKAPWLEGVIPMVMLLVTIVLMLMLHVLNR